MKPITVEELIHALKEMNCPKALVGISVDSEGNGYSLIGNEYFMAQGYMPKALGYAELSEEKKPGYAPAIILFGTN